MSSKWTTKNTHTHTQKPKPTPPPFKNNNNNKKQYQWIITSLCLNFTNLWQYIPAWHQIGGSAPAPQNSAQRDSLGRERPTPVPGALLVAWCCCPQRSGRPPCRLPSHCASARSGSAWSSQKDQSRWGGVKVNFIITYSGSQLGPIAH